MRSYATWFVNVALPIMFYLHILHSAMSEIEVPLQFIVVSTMSFPLNYTN